MQDSTLVYSSREELDKVVEHLQGDAAQQRLNDFIEHENLADLHRLFEEASDNLTHPEIEQILAKIDDKNEWSRIGNYLNDLAVILYLEIFNTETGALKPEIIAAINTVDAQFYATLRARIDEQGLKKAILCAYLQKLFLNSSQDFLLLKAEKGLEMQLLVSNVNKDLMNFSENLDLEQCHQLARRCKQVGPTIAIAYQELVEHNQNLDFDFSEIQSQLDGLEEITRNAHQYILPSELIECEQLISSIEASSEYPMNHFVQIVDNAFQKVMRKEFEAHRNHSYNAFNAQLIKSHLRKELRQLQNDLKEELIHLNEMLQSYEVLMLHLIDDECQVNIDELKENIQNLQKNLPVIEKLLTHENLSEQDVIKIKLKVMSDSIALSCVEIGMQQLRLESRSEPSDGIKISTLNNFTQILKHQKQNIDMKLQQTRTLTREDITAPMEVISSERSSVHGAVSGHTFWLFLFLSKIGFHINTRSEKLLETAETRLSRGKNF